MTQAAAMALARPFLRPSAQAEEDDVVVVVNAVVVDDDADDFVDAADVDTNAPPLGIAYRKLLFCVSISSDRVFLFLWVLLFRGRDAAARSEPRAADTCSKQANTSTSSISSTGSIVRGESRHRRLGMMDLQYSTAVCGGCVSPCVLLLFCMLMMPFS